MFHVKQLGMRRWERGKMFHVKHFSSLFSTFFNTFSTLCGKLGNVENRRAARKRLDKCLCKYYNERWMCKEKTA